MLRYNLVVVFLCFSFISFGQCKGDCQNGKGVYKYKDSGDKYDGEWLDSRKHGQGVYIWKNGDKYDGEWFDGRQNGYGILINKKPKKTETNRFYQYIYEGEWLNGRRHGEGTQSYHNHLIWQGIFESGKQLEGHYNTENYYYSNDILGVEESCRIELDVADDKSYNIFVSFGEINQEFIFDTGANSGFSCPTSFIKKLKKAGVKIEFLKFESQAELADNSKIDIKYAIVDGVKIGDYTINNLVVQYANNASFLLGTGALAKFNDWSISGKKGVLTLYK